MHLRHLLLLSAVALVIFGGIASAQTETPPAAALTAPAPAPPAPPAAPLPVQVALPAVIQRREETPAPAAVPAAGAPPPSPLATRVSAAMTALRGQGAVVQQLAERDQTIAQLRIELTGAQAQLAGMTSELTQHRVDHAALSAALAQMEGQRSTVTSELAAIGFPSAQLPAQGAEGAATTVEGLRAQLKTTDDPKAKHRLSMQIRALLTPAKPATV